MNACLLVAIGVGVWVFVFAFTIACGKAAAKPWPKRVQRFRKPLGYGYRPRGHNDPRPPRGPGQ